MATAFNAPRLGSMPVELNGGRLSPNASPAFSAALSASELDPIQAGCFPWLQVTFSDLPDNVRFSHRNPTLEDMRKFVFMHGPAMESCTNDTSMSVLAEYLFTNVVQKVSVGADKNKPIAYPCGYTALAQAGATKCVHAGVSSDPSKFIYVLTRSKDPVWAPMCFQCVGKRHEIDFSGVFRRPIPTRRGRRHEYVTAQLEAALSRTLSLCFEPSRGIHALNVKKGTPRHYLNGAVDQEMLGYGGDQAAVRSSGAFNLKVQHTRVGLLALAQLEEKFARLEDPHRPKDVMFAVSTDINECPEAVALLRAKCHADGGGFMKRKIKNQTWVLPVDIFNYAKRLMKWTKMLKSANIAPTFDVSFGTQSQLYRRAENMISSNKKASWIVYDIGNALRYSSGRVAVASTIAQLSVAFLKSKPGAHVLVLHGDQFGHRGLGAIFEMIVGYLGNKPAQSVHVMSLFSANRQTHPEKGLPAINYFGRGADIFKNFDERAWAAFNRNGTGSTRSYTVLPANVHSIMTIGTFAASSSRHEPWPHMTMVMPSPLQTHVEQLWYGATSRYGNRGVTADPCDLFRL